MSQGIKITKDDLKRKAFVKDVVINKKTLKQAYKDNVARGPVTESCAEVEGSKYLSKPKTQEELIRLTAHITPEYVTERINEIASTAPLKETQLKALIALGNTRKASIFKDSAPTITNNTLNVFDLDDLRRRLADNTYSIPSISDEST